MTHSPYYFMTEDDTLRKLCRPTFSQLAEMIFAFNIEFNGENKDELRRRVLAKGWTIQEYIIAHMTYYTGIRNE